MFFGEKRPKIWKLFIVETVVFVISACGYYGDINSGGRLIVLINLPPLFVFFLTQVSQVGMY